MRGTRTGRGSGPEGAMNVSKEPPQERTHAAIWELLVLIPGIALGLWLVVPGLGAPWHDHHNIVLVIGAILGGVSLVGPLLLLKSLRVRSRARPWRAGRVLWFAQGTASWLLWPPMIWSRAHGRDLGPASVCYFYGTPLMAVYVTLALLAGGWLRPRRRRHRPLPWRERFGVLLGLAWACTGLYVLYLIYNVFPKR